MTAQAEPTKDPAAVGHQDGPESVSASTGAKATASSATSIATLAETLRASLAAGTREAFTAMLTEDVRWGGERPDGEHECTTRDEASDHYAGLLDAGVTMTIADLQPAPVPTAGPTADPANHASGVFTATMQVQSPDPVDYPPHMPVRLTLRDGLIAEICVLDPPPTIEGQVH